MKRAHVAAAAAALLLIAACASDDDGAGDAGGSGQPEVPQTPSSPLSTGPVAESTTAPDESSNGATSAPTTDPSSAPATAPSSDGQPAEPLVEPSISLFEVGTFDQPVDVAARPGGAEIYVVEQPGRVVAVTDLSTEVVLDITDLTRTRGEQGLLGLAFHPTADLAYVNFTDSDGDTVVAEFVTDPATGVMDRASLREVLTIDQPYGNHNGGQLAFGPDQLLYIGVGDGGSGGDPERVALDLTSRLGKILRIDPTATGDAPFTAPADNPFADTPDADPAIWAYGLRNPWRFSFDRTTGDMWIGDVGQGDFEELNRSLATSRSDAARGANFGWSAFEGYERFNDDQPADGALAPHFVYDHSDGRCSVTGGTVVRGEAVADLTGWYLFGDYCSGQIWALDPASPPEQPRVVELAQLEALSAIVEIPGGDVYAVSNAGTVARMTAG
jgi:glucose/arabinose dehydrogenase